MDTPTKRYDLKIEFDVAAPMRDGTVLRANIFRPEPAGAYPVVLCRTPYGKNGSLGPILDPLRLASSGYLVVIQDVRGRGSSEGEWVPFKNEGLDGHDSVEWAAELPDSSGMVGMVGASYVGFTQWAAALQAPSHLKAIVPVVTFADAYDGFVGRGGALELGLIGYWLLAATGMDVLQRRAGELTVSEFTQAVRELADEIDALGATNYKAPSEGWLARLGKHNLAQELLTSIRTGTPLPYLSPFADPDARTRIRVPSLNIGGWYDIFAQGTLQNFSRFRKDGVTPEARQAKLIMGPWTHADFGHVIGDADFGVAASLDCLDLHSDLTGLTQRWFDYWLKNVDNGVAEEPPVKVFTMGENRWRSETSWPPPNVHPTPFYLRNGGLLSLSVPAREAPDHYTFTPEDPTPTVGGALHLHGAYKAGVKDQRALVGRRDVLTYTSEPLSQDLRVMGPVEVFLWAASDAPVTDFVARLNDVHPNGFVRNLTDGIVRTEYQSDGTGVLPRPGRPAEFVVDLWATANVFKAGNRVQLQIASASFPRWDLIQTVWDHPSSTASHVIRHTIWHDEGHLSRVLLPIVVNG